MASAMNLSKALEDSSAIKAPNQPEYLAKEVHTLALLVSLERAFCSNLICRLCSCSSMGSFYLREDWMLNWFAY
jgi:hypothetical protein